MKPLKVTSDLLNVVLCTVFQGSYFHVYQPMSLLLIGVLQSFRYVFSFTNVILLNIAVLSPKHFCNVLTINTWLEIPHLGIV